MGISGIAASKTVRSYATLSVCCGFDIVISLVAFHEWTGHLQEQHGNSAGQLLPSPHVGILDWAKVADDRRKAATAISRGRIMSRNARYVAMELRSILPLPVVFSAERQGFCWTKDRDASSGWLFRK